MPAPELFVAIADEILKHERRDRYEKNYGDRADSEMQPSSLQDLGLSEVQRLDVHLNCLESKLYLPYRLLA